MPQDLNPDATNRIDDLKRFTLGQRHNRGLYYYSPEPPHAPHNPMKRGVGVEKKQAGPYIEESQDTIRSSHRRAMDRSNSTLDDNHDQANTIEFRKPRTSLGNARGLWHPNLDNSTSGTPEPTNQRPEKSGIGLRHDVSYAMSAGKPSLMNMGHVPLVGSRRDDLVQLQRSVKIARDPDELRRMEIDPVHNQDEATSAAATQDGDLAQEPELGPEPVLLLQPETRPISHDQLVVEVKGIYAGLVLVDFKCIEVAEKQAATAQEKNPSLQTRLTNEQWQALIHLHKTLLHEHHDFFLASQNPSASIALGKLAAKYSMPARMWSHGIHAFLEVLRHRLPESLDHMLTFIYIAYSMMALLYETVSNFEDTWVECLGDLKRYRMAVEDDDQRDRDLWSGVVLSWYSKAADKNPSTGRLYHHLAILSRSYTLQQLSFYTRSLTCLNPFESARASITTLFNPILDGKESAYHRSTSVETMIIKAHGILFCKQAVDQLYAIVNQLNQGLLDKYIGRITSKFKEQGVFAVIANISALFEYGIFKGILPLLYGEIRQLKHDQVEPASRATPRLSDDQSRKTSDATGDNYDIKSFEQQSSLELTPQDMNTSGATISCASQLTFSMLLISLQHLGDRHFWPLIHVTMVFIYSLTIADKAMRYVGQDIPWGSICSLLNNLAKSDSLTARVSTESFPQPEGMGRPLPEDYVIRGQIYSQWYFPDTWLTGSNIDEEELTLELPSMAARRVERVPCLGMRFCEHFEYEEVIGSTCISELEWHQRVAYDRTADWLPNNTIIFNKDSISKLGTGLPSSSSTVSESNWDSSIQEEEEITVYVTLARRLQDGWTKNVSKSLSLSSRGIVSKGFIKSVRLLSLGSLIGNLIGSVWALPTPTDISVIQKRGWPYDKKVPPLNGWPSLVIGGTAALVITLFTSDEGGSRIPLLVIALNYIAIRLSEDQETTSELLWT